MKKDEFKKLLEKQDKVLTKLNNTLGDFYLAGGTALSKYYFKHRNSFDLDFFTQRFNKKNVDKIIECLSKEFKTTIELTDYQLQEPDKPNQLIYALPVERTDTTLRIDFVEDYHKLRKPLVKHDGIPCLALEDIYLRKILAACGELEIEDKTGRNNIYGGRQEAKDFFDLYHLSKTFMPLSKFANTYCTQAQKESIIVWHKKFDRNTIKMGLPDIITEQTTDYRILHEHLEDQIDELTCSLIPLPKHSNE